MKNIQYTDNAVLPTSFIIPPSYNPNSSRRTRDWVMTETLDMAGNSLGLQLNHKGFMAGIDDTVQLGSREIWRYVNTTMDMHPMHIHLVAFNILDRTPFDVAQFKATGNIVFTGPPEIPPANELNNWKDEVMAPPGYVSRVIAQYNRPGKYVTHCHILGHEENDMMRGFIIMPTKDTSFGGGMVAGETPIEPTLTVVGAQPFRGRASIAYSTDYEQHVRLSVYNSLGQRVKTLINGTVAAGLHSMSWDGTNETGRQVASGAYFCKLETPGSSQTIRTVLLR